LFTSQQIKKQERIDYINLTIRDKITSAYNAAGGDFIKYGKNQEIFFGIDFSNEEMNRYKNLNYDEFLFKGDSIIKNKGETFIQIKPLRGDSFYLYSPLKIDN